MTFRDRHPDDLVDRKTAAALLGVSPRTLEAWASAGTGPAFVRLGEGPKGRTKYRISRLLAWVLERERLSTTNSPVAP